MSTRRKAKKKSNLAVRIVLVAVAAFLFFKLVQLHSQIEEKQQLIDNMNSNIIKQQLINEDLSEQIENADAYLERQANEAGLGLPGQQVYQNAAG
ncbi:MAG: hypothetical protein IJO76_05505 [Clostridia bacterium]|nr:hypothetical protein [Clostridia bacterium]